MTGTLDRIETKIAGETRFPTVVLTKDEAEALVDVAKAALHMLESFPHDSDDDRQALADAFARLEDNQ